MLTYGAQWAPAKQSAIFSYGKCNYRPYRREPGTSKRQERLGYLQHQEIVLETGYQDQRAEPGVR